jgi:Winged helix-turn helix
LDEDSDANENKDDDVEVNDDMNVNLSPSTQLNNQSVLNKKQLEALISEVDDRHVAGETVTRKKMINFIKDKFDITISRSSMFRYFHKCGLSYKPTQKHQKKKVEYRMDLLRDYIIDFNNIFTNLNNPDYEFVPVFTDESYCHQNHGRQDSWLSK